MQKESYKKYLHYQTFGKTEPIKLIVDEWLKIIEILEKKVEPMIVTLDCYDEAKIKECFNNDYNIDVKNLNEEDRLKALTFGLSLYPDSEKKDFYYFDEGHVIHQPKKSKDLNHNLSTCNKTNNYRDLENKSKKPTANK